MAETAFQTQYRQEFIKGFEKRQSLVRMATTTEVVIKGNEAVFLVVDSGGATAVTRGVNGDIPTRAVNNTQYTCTLAEWHDIPEMTGFNIFASQGNQRQAMQYTSMAVVNRKVDSDIYTALETGTLTWNSGSAATASLANVSKAKTMIANNFGNLDAPLWAVITPAYHAYLMTLAQFTSADYVTDKRFEGVGKDRAFSWFGVNWIVDAGLTGVGTATARSYMWSQAAIGHAMNMAELMTAVGYDEKQDKSWCRVSGFFGSKVLQNSGIVKMLHNDSAYSA
jgi:hypothetical protein